MIRPSNQFEHQLCEDAFGEGVMWVQQKATVDQMIALMQVSVEEVDEEPGLALECLRAVTDPKRLLPDEVWSDVILGTSSASHNWCLWFIGGAMNQIRQVLERNRAQLMELAR